VRATVAPHAEIRRLIGGDFKATARRAPQMGHDLGRLLRGAYTRPLSDRHHSDSASGQPVRVTDATRRGMRVRRRNVVIDPWDRVGTAGDFMLPQGLSSLVERARTISE
jgi:hypothetical protein